MTCLFSVLLTNRAKKQLIRLKPSLRSRVEELFEALEIRPVPAGEYDLKKIKGEADTYRIRISSYRIAYKVYWDRKAIGVAKIERRSETTYE